jgi:hypothetical protein
MVHKFTTINTSGVNESIVPWASSFELKFTILIHPTRGRIINIKKGFPTASRALVLIRINLANQQGQQPVSEQLALHVYTSQAMAI